MIADKNGTTRSCDVHDHTFDGIERKFVDGTPGSYSIQIGLQINFILNRIDWSTGCPRMFYTQKCKILRIFITIKAIEFGILIYLSDTAVLLAFWRI